MLKLVLLIALSASMGISAAFASIPPLSFGKPIKQTSTVIFSLASSASELNLNRSKRYRIQRIAPVQTIGDPLPPKRGLGTRSDKPIKVKRVIKRPLTKKPVLEKKVEEKNKPASVFQKLKDPWQHNQPRKRSYEYKNPEAPKPTQNDQVERMKKRQEKHMQQLKKAQKACEKAEDQAACIKRYQER